MQKISEQMVIGVGEVLWDMLPAGKQCGGAPANVVYHLSRLGIRSTVVSAVGNDALGDELLDFLKSKGVSTEFIARSSYPTGVMNVSVKQGIPSYDIRRHTAWDDIVLSDSLKNSLDKAAVVIWGTLAQRNEVSRNAIRELLQSVPASCLKCFDINLRQNYFNAQILDESLNFADVLKINDEEVMVTAGLLHISGSQEEIIRQLYSTYALKYVICTLGAEGSLLFDGEKFTKYPVKPCKVVDTVGCGDSFLAAWCAAILHGKTAEQGMMDGTELSAHVAECAGAMCD